MTAKNGGDDPNMDITAYIVLLEVAPSGEIAGAGVRCQF